MTVDEDGQAYYNGVPAGDHLDPEEDLLDEFPQDVEDGLSAEE